jgi:hypothetical protein
MVYSSIEMVVAMKDWLHYPAFCGAASALRIMKKLLIPDGEYNQTFGFKG